MNFRSANLNDSLQLDNLLTKLVEDEKINYDKYINIGKINGLYQTLLINNNTHAFVCEENNKIVGYIYCYVNNESIGILDALYIEEEYRGLGIATKLIELAINWLKDEKLVKLIEISVMDKNELAKKLYKKLGFQKFKETLRIEI
jgi:ribosomal protein S18 acetylase RimI-like enzyme